MPLRKFIFANEEFYHLFSRSVYRQPIFEREKDAKIFLQVMEYYTQSAPPVKFSYFRKSRDKYSLNFQDRLVTIVSFCLMPNHFHISVCQEKQKGVPMFMHRVLNSFSHYYQKKHERHGPVFESQYKAVHIETNEQLIHLSRYHHLNPVTAYIVDHPKDYPFSSYHHYLGRESPVIDPSHVLHQFASPESYEKFVLNRKEYQRELEKIKHLTFT